MKTISLSKGLFALVDDDDYDYLMQWNWCATKNRDCTFYAKRTQRQNGKGVSVFMHREILKTPDGMYVDHIDHNGLNNRKSNIRNCTPSQNQYNRRKGKTRISSSQYRGVSFEKDRNKWGVRIRKDRKNIRVGRFDTEIEAAIAYNSAAKQHYGQFANPNLV